MHCGGEGGVLCGQPDARWMVRWLHGGVVGCGGVVQW